MVAQERNAQLKYAILVYKYGTIHVCMYVCMYACMYVCTYVYMCHLVHVDGVVGCCDRAVVHLVCADHADLNSVASPGRADKRAIAA